MHLFYPGRAKSKDEGREKTLFRTSIGKKKKIWFFGEVELCG